MQKEILQISTQSEFIIVENSAHYKQNDAPSVVVEAINKLLNNF